MHGQQNIKTTLNVAAGIISDLGNMRTASPDNKRTKIMTGQRQS